MLRKHLKFNCHIKMYLIVFMNIPLHMKYGKIKTLCCKEINEGIEYYK